MSLSLSTSIGTSPVEGGALITPWMRQLDFRSQESRRNQRCELIKSHHNTTILHYDQNFNIRKYVHTQWLFVYKGKETSFCTPPNI